MLNGNFVVGIDYLGVVVGKIKGEVDNKLGGNCFETLR
jgi:hypothetical protein